MLTYQQYKRLAIKELVGKFPEEIDKEIEERENEYKDKPALLNLIDYGYAYSKSDLHQIINSLIMIDLGKELKK